MSNWQIFLPTQISESTEKYSRLQVSDNDRDIPYILDSNPQLFYSFRGLKNQMRIRIDCGLDSRPRAAFWKNDRAGILTFFSFKKVVETRCGLDSRIYSTFWKLRRRNCCSRWNKKFMMSRTLSTNDKFWISLKNHGGLLACHSELLGEWKNNFGASAPGKPRK
jgi:hypothetical protein